jgi:hypothetical protein
MAKTFGSGDPIDDLLIDTAISAVEGHTSVAAGWPLARGPRVLALDIFGRHAGVWVGVVGTHGSSVESVVSLSEVDGKWSAYALGREDGFSGRNANQESSPIYAWSYRTSFRELDPTGTVMVWGRAKADVHRVESGFGFTEPVTREVEVGTGCFLMVNVVNQDQATTFHSIVDSRGTGIEPILRTWSRAGSVMDLSSGFTIRRNVALSTD